MADTPYNFLLIMTDQQRADHLRCYGNTVLATPHLDRIAAGGVRFERFYVANPVCRPSRATLMTGRLPSNHGVQHNGLPLHPRSNTFVHLLRKAGYRTAMVGKSHLRNMGTGPTVLHLAGLEPYHGIQGQSLVPLCTDPTAVVRTMIDQQDRTPLPEYLA